MVSLSLPLSVVYYRPKTTRGKIRSWILNMNNYRNAPFIVLAQAKKAYTELMKPLIPEGLCFSKVYMVYTYHHGNKRRIDTMNPVSIIDKFFCDALVTYKVIPDDDGKVIKGHTILIGDVDKDNPRCDVSIYEYGEYIELLNDRK